MWERSMVRSVNAAVRVDRVVSIKMEGTWGRGKEGRTREMYEYVVIGIQGSRPGAHYLEERRSSALCAGARIDIEKPSRRNDF